MLIKMGRTPAVVSQGRVTLEVQALLAAAASSHRGRFGLAWKDVRRLSGVTEQVVFLLFQRHRLGPYFNFWSVSCYCGISCHFYIELDDI